jgi:hypothetical protein
MADEQYISSANKYQLAIRSNPAYIQLSPDLFSLNLQVLSPNPEHLYERSVLDRFSLSATIDQIRHSPIGLA